MAATSEFSYDNGSTKPLDIKTRFNETATYLSGSLLNTGQISSLTLIPGTLPVTPATGSLAVSGSKLYLFTGGGSVSGWATASFS